jgi:hypothetical protein
MRVAQLLGAGAGASAPTVPIETGQPPAVSRRQLLSGVAVLGLGAAAGITAGRAVSDLTAQPASPPTTAAGTAAQTTLILQAPQVRIESIDQQPGVLPSVDRPFAARGLVMDADGAALGSFAITPLPGAGALQLHSFELDGGTLLGLGASTAGEGTFAVIGGTGRYQGVTGSYTARIGADPSGRQPSAEFKFNLSGE